MKLYAALLFSLIFSALPVKAKNFYEVEQINILEANTTINPALHEYIASSVKKLNPKKKHLLLLKLNTPGGLVKTTREIISTFAKANYPLVIWVTPQGGSATSAGAIISAAAQFLFMAEGTNIGAATPIQMGKDIEGDMRNKAVNDLSALVKSLAKANGRNVEAYAKMVEKAKSYDAFEAEKINITNGIANDMSELIKKIDDKTFVLNGKSSTVKIKNPTTITHEPNTAQKIFNILADPTFAYILFIIGAACLYLELQAPGGFIAGGVGVLCLILAGLGFQVLPLNIVALLLLILSFILFLMEVYITSYGILTIGGIASFAFGSLFLFESAEGNVLIPRELILSSGLAVTTFLGLMTWYLFKSKKHKIQISVSPGREVTIVNEKGDNHYQVKIDGEIWKASSQQNFESGEIAIIEKVEGLNLVIKRK